MKALRHVALIAIILSVAGAGFAQSRGEGRIYGTVKDSSGLPVEGAQVKAVKVGDKEPLTAKTNKKGEWTIAGMAGGTWNIDASKEGFQTKSISVQVSEEERLPRIDLVLAKAAVDPNAEIQALVKKGDELFDQKQYAESRKVYEDLLAKYPDAWQLELRIARSLEADNQKEEALKHMQNALAKDPNNVEIKLYIAGQMMELKKDDEARKLLDSIDMSKVTDPVLFLNAGITLINQGKASDAKAMFDKVIEHFPNAPEGYYYRGRAYLAMNSFPEAKADLQKFISLAKPDAPEVAEAKKILEQLK